MENYIFASNERKPIGQVHFNPVKNTKVIFKFSAGGKKIFDLSNIKMVEIFQEERLVLLDDYETEQVRFCFEDDKRLQQFVGGLRKYFGFVQIVNIKAKYFPEEFNAAEKLLAQLGRKIPIFLVCKPKLVGIYDSGESLKSLVQKKLKNYGSIVYYYKGVLLEQTDLSNTKESKLI